MTIIGGFNRAPLPTTRQVMEITPTPQSDASINAAIRQSVQEFPPAINTGAFFADMVRGPLLPPYGTRDRDRILRLMFRGEYNNLVQAVVSSLIKKIVTVPYQLNGSTKDLLTIPDETGRLHTITAVDHYQNVLQNAQFGAGWEVFLSRYLEDFFVQDFGGVMELSGPGEPIYPITGPVTGIAQLDAGRCYITGNPYYPIMYFSLISGSLHRMHARRVVRLVDSPSPDERYFGIGLCAVSRTVAVANRQQLMNKYIEGLVDDKPPPGFMLTQGFTEKQRNNAIEAYKREQGVDERPIWGKTLWIYSLDADKPIKAEHFPFSQAPEKFDWVKYTELDVHALAAGFNIDIQEIWELTGRGGAGGNSGQSQTLHQKSEAKMIGFLLQNLERAFNRNVFPPSVTMEFKYNDPVQQETEATVDGQLATNAVALVTGQIMSSLEVRTYLASQSDRYKDAMQVQRDTITAPDAADSTEPDDTATTDVVLPPAPAQPALPSGQPSKPQTGAAPTPATGLSPKPPTGIQPKLGAGTPKPPTSSPLNAAHASNPRKQRPGNQMGAGIKSITPDEVWPGVNGDSTPPHYIPENMRDSWIKAWGANYIDPQVQEPADSDDERAMYAHLATMDQLFPGWQQSQTKDFSSDDQRKAFFGNLASGSLLGGSGGGKEPFSFKLAPGEEQRVESGQNRISQMEREVRLANTSDEKNHAQFRLDHAKRMHEASIAKINADEVKSVQALHDEQSISKQIQQTDLQRQALLKDRKLASPAKRAVIDDQIKGLNGQLRQLGDAFDKVHVNRKSIYKNFSITSKDFEREFRMALYKGIDGKLDKNAFEEKLLDMLTSGAVKAYADGLRDGGAKPDLNDEHYGDIQDFLVGQIDYIDGLGKQLQDGTVAPEVQQKAYKSVGEKGLDDVFRIVARKARQWVNKSLRVMFEKGRLFADPDSNYTFDGEDGQESCPTCQRLKGQVHPLSAWHSAGLVPRIDTDSYDCGGFKCMHFLSRTERAESGDF